MAASSYPGIFLLSLPRAGSTLLRLILDTHPQICCPDEIHLGRLVATLYPAFSGLREKADTENAPLSPGDPVLADVRRVVGDVMAGYTERKGKTYWCEKTPGNVDHMSLLAAALPEARFLMLHRHSLDFVQSCIRSLTYGQTMPMLEPHFRRHHPYYVPALIDAWEEKSAEMIRFEREMGPRAHRLRYEDLVKKPEPTLAALFRFLALDFDPALIDKVFTTEHHQRPTAGDHRAYVSTRISDDSIGLGSTLPWTAVSTTPLALREKMNTRLEQLGYPRTAFRADGFETGLEKKKPAASEISPRALFEQILPPRLPALGEVPADLARPLRFVVGGPNSGAWTLDLSRRPAEITAGGTEGIEIRIASADLEAFVGGRMPFATLFGRIRFGAEVAPESFQGFLKALLAT
ncbi:MAG TPA: sulfotransferase [Thermoanaerobaculia bacterium]|nr:sulfotransferase [Thermoanaerobaculia bacterium]